MLAQVGSLGRSWGSLGAVWAALGALLAALGVLLAALGALLGPSWPLLGFSWPLLGHSWPLLARSWGLLGVSWGLLGRSWQPTASFTKIVLPLQREHDFQGSGGPSWPQVGPKLAPSWPKLAHVGPSCPHLGLKPNPIEKTLRFFCTRSPIGSRKHRVLLASSWPETQSDRENTVFLARDLL